MKVVQSSLYLTNTSIKQWPPYYGYSLVQKWQKLYTLYLCNLQTLFTVHLVSALKKFDCTLRIDLIKGQVNKYCTYLKMCLYNTWKIIYLKKTVIKRMWNSVHMPIFDTGFKHGEFLISPVLVNQSSNRPSQTVALFYKGCHTMSWSRAVQYFDNHVWQNHIFTSIFSS